MTDQNDIPALFREALARFGALLDEAVATGMNEPMAMQLATANADGIPSVRTMLLKGFDERGFVFYTNRESRKGGELEANPHAALCFFWRPMMRQVRVEGKILHVNDDEADTYWATRPRESQLGAWASQQSQIIGHRDVLLARMEESRERFAGIDEIPRPPHWSGFVVVPSRIEFWESMDFRLHNREIYENTPDGWVKYLLNP